jgi:ubiquinone/menaquinone biosynthesis C-methylase UbiE
MTAAPVPTRIPDDHERLRLQARGWEHSTGRLLDEIALARGMRCLDVGCGPGELMRLLAQRVGPEGHVTGLDVTADVGAGAIASLHAAGHVQCSFVHGDLTADDPFPERRFDLVYARLLLLHVDEPVAALRRLWSWTEAGGHLVVQEYDFRGGVVEPPLAAFDELRRVTVATLAAAGRDIHTGQHLPALFEAAGIGVPDGIDVAGRLEPLDGAKPALAAAYRSLLPTAVSLGLTTHADSEALLAELDSRSHPRHYLLWPLLVGVHKRNEQGRTG